MHRGRGRRLLLQLRAERVQLQHGLLLRLDRGLLGSPLLVRVGLGLGLALRLGLGYRVRVRVRVRPALSLRSSARRLSP